MKLWVDDIRPMPDGFDRHARTAMEAIKLIESGVVTTISLDHDLGSENPDNTGYAIAKFIMVAAKHGWIEPINWMIHSANPVGRGNMEAALRKADEFWGGYKTP